MLAGWVLVGLAASRDAPGNDTRAIFSARKIVFPLSPFGAESGAECVNLLVSLKGGAFNGGVVEFWVDCSQNLQNFLRFQSGVRVWNLQSVPLKHSGQRL